MKRNQLLFYVTISIVFATLIACEKGGEPPSSSRSSDTAAVVFGPSLAELFYLSGTDGRLVGVDRYSVWPDEIAEKAVVGDFLSPSLEKIVSLGTTSIHVVGRNQSLEELAERLGVPCYHYSFDRLSDVYETCDRLHRLYPEAKLDNFVEEIEFTLDSLSGCFQSSRPTVMVVVYLGDDGAITLAGNNTFYSDILRGMGCIPSAPETGSYPTVSVEGVLSLAPQYVIILDPYGEGNSLIEKWRTNGLEDFNPSVVSGDFVLIPGARLPRLIKAMARCLS